MRFKLSIAGDVQLDRELEAIAEHAEGVDTVLRAIGLDLGRVAQTQFETEGRYASGGWRFLTPAYRKRKARMVATGRIINGRRAQYLQILRLTDRLRLSLVQPQHPEHIETVVNHKLTWGTSVPYAGAHQNPKPGNPLPQRRFLELPEQKRQAYLRAVLTFVRTGKHGL